MIIINSTNKECNIISAIRKNLIILEVLITSSTDLAIRIRFWQKIKPGPQFGPNIIFISFGYTFYHIENAQSTEPTRMSPLTWHEWLIHQSTLARVPDPISLTGLLWILPPNGDFGGHYSIVRVLRVLAVAASTHGTRSRGVESWPFSI